MPAAPAMPQAQAGIAYTLRSGTAYRLAPAAALTVHFPTVDTEYGPGAMLADADDTDVSQRWMASAAPPDAGGETLMSLVNGSSKEALGTLMLKSNDPNPFDQPGEIDVAQPTTATPTPMWDVVVNGSDMSMAVRLPDDHTNNLNALEGAVGGGNARAGTPVGLWSWGGGQSNEIWYFDPVVLDPTPVPTEAHAAPA
jgi:hypothetical protein